MVYGKLIGSVNGAVREIIGIGEEGERMMTRLGIKARALLKRHNDPYRKAFRWIRKGNGLK